MKKTQELKSYDVEVVSLVTTRYVNNHRVMAENEEEAYDNIYGKNVNHPQNVNNMSTCNAVFSNKEETISVKKDYTVKEII